MFLSRPFFYIFIFLSFSSFAQAPLKIHSHNDYNQLLPFWKAYTNGLESIEVDVFLKNNTLYATHEAHEIKTQNTFESLYLKPLRTVFKPHLGAKQQIQLLIDIKSEAYTTLTAIEKVLETYPDLTNNPKLSFVISGHRPELKDYNTYPDYILFDYQSLAPIPEKAINKIALISLSYKMFSSWKGQDSIPKKDLKILKSIVDQAHAHNKSFRFWGAPDTPLAWHTFYTMGVDFINTDQPQECANYFNTHNATTNTVEIAFISDIHFQDIYGEFSDNEYKGIYNNKTNKHTLLRTMDAQLHSTRIFNENYFALFAALDDMVKKGIKYVALPGDYTDDGQAIHLKGLQQILQSYEITYGMQFFITTGNHDPVGPFAQDSGKSDFMGINGQSQGIYSYSPLKNNSKTETTDLPVIRSKDIKKLGYTGVLNHLKSFGFFPEAHNLYWATPFSKYTAETYTYQAALQQSSITNRMYNITPGYTIPDASYVVEAAPNVWLLGLDANVYLPKDSINGNALNPKNYTGASIGYNNVLTHKTHLITWVKTIASEAKRLNKTLIAFSHYPMIDFNDDASEALESFFEGKKWQLERVPQEAVSQLFFDAGIKIHVAGHMHINDTGIRTFKNEESLINIQTPSIAAYIPGYKILKIKANNEIEVNTVQIDTVPNFDDLFPLYEKEYKHLTSEGKSLWNHDILNSTSYHDFSMFHLKELVRLRFLEEDWVPRFKDFMLNITAEELLLLPYLNTNIPINTLCLEKTKYKTDWELADNKAVLALQTSDLTLEDFKDWTGFDMIFDFYRIRNADVLAITDIGDKQIAIYKWLFDTYKTTLSQNKNDDNRQKLLAFSSIFLQFLNGAPANNFTIDYNTGTLKTMEN
ncbi:metallophosphoesterase [Formosa undariae]|uniref:Metallophosphoesterase n=1 Tax=Formosa undariae TaxID=1325436 RepID=A0ABV5F5W9_9FLAO